MSVETYEKGQLAALEKVASAIDSGYSPKQLWQEIGQVLGSPLEKNASQDDIDGRVGVEEALFSFMSKSASYYGRHHVNDEYEALCDIFEKVANETRQAKIQELRAARGDDFKGIGGAGGPMPEGRQSRGRQEAAKYLEGAGYEGAPSGAEGSAFGRNGAKARAEHAGSLSADIEGGARSPMGRAGARFDQLKNWAGNNKLQAAGAGVGSAAALGGLTYLGYNALTDDDEEEQAKAASQRKTASYGEGDIDTAIAILEDAGYLEA